MKKILHLSSYPPEDCGIASYAKTVIDYSNIVIDKDSDRLKQGVVVMNGHLPKERYSFPVELVVDRNDFAEYARIADYINNHKDVAFIHVQHEFGIYGGISRGVRTGSYILDFLDKVNKPIAVTLHSVLGTNVPKARDSEDIIRFKRGILEEIISHDSVNKVIVISDTSRRIITGELHNDDGLFKVNPEKIKVVYHGYPDFNETKIESRKKLNLPQDKFIATSVGFVSPRKGIHYAVEAMKDIVKSNANVFYVIAGTRRVADDELSEQYSNKLEQMVDEFSLDKNIFFVDSNLSDEEFLRYLNAADVYLGLGQDGMQVSSGPMSYKFGTESPVVIATPFLYSRDLLANGRGVLLDSFDEPSSIEEAVLTLANSPSKMESIKEEVYRFRDKMKWENVAREGYVDIARNIIANSY